MDIKDLIKSKRIEKGYTMKELADLVGVSEATISRWESGEVSNMKRSGIVRLSQVLDVTPAHLMGWEEEKEPEYEIQTIAAHHDGEDWTEEELEEIERFKAFVKSKRQK